MNNFMLDLWALFTNDGMYSTSETVCIILIAAIATTLFLRFQFHRAKEEERSNAIADLGYAGYLEHIEHIKQMQGISSRC